MADFVTLNTALSALQAARVRVNVASNNIANVNTPGYTRQRVDLTPREGWESQYGRLGDGVDVTAIARARDAFLDARVRTATSTAGEMSAKADLLDRAEQVLAEPESGISMRLDALWAAFEELGMAPDNVGARTAVIGALEDVALRVREVASGWEALQQDATLHISSRVDEVNGLLRQVADLNEAIAASSFDGPPNDLLDQRDAVIDELSSAIGATFTEMPNGTVRVSLSGMSLVTDYTVSELSFDSLTNTIVHSAGVAVTPGGEIGGYLDFVTNEVPSLIADLNTFVSDLATTLNTQHALGFKPDGTAGGPLFQFVAGSEAQTLTVAVSDSSEIAASSATGSPFPVNNGVNAQALADLRSTTSLGSTVREMAVDLGAKTAAARASAQAQLGLAAAASSSRESMQGVNLDEELTEMMSAQHAYDAAARVMTAVDEMLNTLITRTGVVGR